MIEDKTKIKTEVVCGYCDIEIGLLDDVIQIRNGYFDKPSIALADVIFSAASDIEYLHPECYHKIMKYPYTFHLGERIRVPGNAKGSAWEFGKIMDINNNGVIIGYGSENVEDAFLLYGIFPLQRLSFTQIRHVRPHS